MPNDADFPVEVVGTIDEAGLMILAELLVALYQARNPEGEDDEP